MTRARLGVKTISASNPLSTDGAIGDGHTNTTTGEIFTKVDATTWRGTQQSVVAPITEATHPDLLVFYTMDSITGSTLEDETANNRDGTIAGATSVAGKIGNALSFDGSNDSVSVYGTSSTNISGSLWFKGTASSTQFLYGNDGNSTRTRYIAFFNDGNVYFVSRNAAGSAQNLLLSFTPEEWTHLYFEQIGTACKLRLNDSTETTLDTGTLSTDFLSTAYFGRNPASAGNYYAGDLDQFRLFNRALTAEEITLLYNGGAGA